MAGDGLDERRRDPLGRPVLNPESKGDPAMIAINRRAAARFALGMMLIVAPALAGCGDTAAPTAAPADQARKTLDSALGSWVEGKTVEAVKAASPSILVEDPKWKKGVALKKFEVKGEGKPS